MDDAEDGGVGADAERQRQQGDGGEAGRAAQHPRAVADVLHQPFGPWQRPLIGVGLGNLDATAEAEPRFATGAGGIHPLAAQIRFKHLDVKTQLVRQIRIAPPGAAGHERHQPQKRLAYGVRPHPSVFHCAPSVP